MKLKNKKTGEITETDDWNIMIEYNSLAELESEWEDYEEPKEEWYINCTGEVLENNRAYCNTVTPEKLQSIGNYFETKEEAEKAVEKLKAWKRLKDKNFHFLKYSALGCGEVDFSLDFEDMGDEGEIGELRHDLDLLFGGEE